MQATRAIPVADPSQKSKELFLYWLSLSETQYFLRNELSKVCPSISRTAVESFHESDNSQYPLTRAVSPPPSLSKSPRSSKGLTGISPKRRNSSKILNLSSSEKLGVSQERSKANERLEDVPEFYYPNGKKDTSENHQAMLQAATNVFKAKPGGHLTLEDFPTLMQACKLPIYWKAPLFNLCHGTNKTVDLAGFKKTWNRMVAGCHDTASRFVYMMTKGKRRYLLEEDFTELIQDIINSHPGLACLTAAPEFHSRYIETVIARIFYTVSKTWNFKITLSELRKSNFLEVLSELDKEEDINQELEYFSYEHFYVIYCKFWDLDTDHDCIIDADDLARHSDSALLPIIVKQLMSGTVTRRHNSTNGVMSYKDFVWFLLSEEDKTTNRSVEYWFRCMDIDGDGVLSLFELQHFYDEMVVKMDALGIESLSVEDYMCQLLDMVHPKEEGKITLRDLKDSRMATHFFNMCFNFEKYWEFEQDASCKSNADEVDNLSDWERYAQEQYKILAAEEQAEDDSDDDLDDEDRKVLS